MTSTIYYHTVDSTRKDRVQVSPGYCKVVDYKEYTLDQDGSGNTSMEGICYECGGNVKCTWSWAEPAADHSGHLMFACHFKCLVCGLQEELDITNDLYGTGNLPTLEQTNTRLGRGWKLWFTHQLEAMFANGEYPKWLTAGRPQRVEG